MENQLYLDRENRTGFLKLCAIAQIRSQSYFRLSIFCKKMTYLTQWLEYCFHTAVVIGSNPIVGK